MTMGAAGLMDVQREHIDEERGALFPDGGTRHQVEVPDNAVPLPQHGNELVRMVFPPEFEEHPK